MTHARTLLLSATALLSASLVSAGPPSVRILAIAPDALTLAVETQEPSSVQVLHGSQPGAFEHAVDSGGVATHHEIRLSKLPKASQLFYQVQVDGVPAGDFFTARTTGLWSARKALLQFGAPASAAAENPAEAEKRLGDRLFTEEANLLVLLGGSAGRPADLAASHARSLSDRLVVEAGGPDDVDSPRVLAVSDVALAVLGDSEPAAIAAWAKGALDAADGACWRVVASALAFDPQTKDPAGLASLAALAALAKGASADVVVARTSGSPGLVQVDGRPWLLVASPDVALEHATVASRGGKLLLARHATGGSSVTDELTLERDCPLPASVVAARERAAAAAALSDGDGDEHSSFPEDGDLASADCDAP